jgi:hypothetical protein
MDIGKIPPHDTEAEQAVIRKHANRPRCSNRSNRSFKTRRFLQRWQQIHIWSNTKFI